MTGHKDGMVGTAFVSNSQCSNDATVNMNYLTPLEISRPVTNQLTHHPSLIHLEKTTIQQ